MKLRILFLLLFFMTAIYAEPAQAQQGLLLLEKGSAKVIGPKRTLLLRKPGTKMVLQPSDRVQTGKDTSVKIKVRGKLEEAPPPRPANTTATKRIRVFITGRIPAPWRASMGLLRREGR